MSYLGTSTFELQVEALLVPFFGLIVVFQALVGLGEEQVVGAADRDVAELTLHQVIAGKEILQGLLKGGSRRGSKERRSSCALQKSWVVLDTGEERAHQCWQSCSTICPRRA